MFNKRAFFLIVTLVVAAALAMPFLPSAYAQEGKYKEAPMLAAKVAAGELPPVEERLPENPRVVPLAEGDTVGVYGVAGCERLPLLWPHCL